MRIRGIYLIHQPWYFTMFWALVKPFLHKKMVDRLKLLGSDLPALHKLVPRETLPPEFGGTATEDFDWCVETACAQRASTYWCAHVPYRVCPVA